MPKSKTILHVEDSEAGRNLFREALAGSDFGIIQVQTPFEAITYLSTKRADVSLVVLDDGVDDCRGIELIGKIRAHASIWAIPMILLSGNPNPLHILEAYRVGASCVLQKPLDAEGYCIAAKSLTDFWRTAIVPEPDRSWQA